MVELDSSIKKIGPPLSPLPTNPSLGKKSLESSLSNFILKEFIDSPVSIKTPEILFSADLLL